MASLAENQPEEPRTTEEADTEPQQQKKKKKKKKKKKSKAATGGGDTGEENKGEEQVEEEKKQASTTTTTTTAATTSTTTSTVKCVACGKPASMKCPTCMKLGLPVKMASFCSQTCFKANWSSHKSLHKMVRGTKSTKTEVPPADLLSLPREFTGYEFTGAYRPAYVTPRRQCPSDIVRPDYADHVEGVALSEQAARHQAPPQFGTKEMDRFRKICVLGREIVDVAGKAVAVGVTGDELDRIVHEATIERGGYPSPLNYYQFPKSVCVSPNEVICHGVPNCRPIKNGDIVNLDVTIYKDGLHADLNETFLVGDVSDEHVQLVVTAYKCLQVAANSVKVSVHFLFFSSFFSPFITFLFPQRRVTFQ